MDTYGTINLTELDRMIENIKREMSSPITTRGFTTMSSEISLLQDIKELCLKLPSANNVFDARKQRIRSKYNDHNGKEKIKSTSKYTSFTDYITQFIKPDKP